jgi:hypothetical protein
VLELKTKADLQRVVDEALDESLTLDFKASPALTRDGKGPDELCKDVSALANSAGGQLIYGIEEDKALAKPSKVDDGVTDPKITREWIDQILNSKVQPRMDGVRIERIDMENGKYGYVLTVQQSQTGPHQAPDGKYYKRFNFQSVPMHDYEIRDIMRRATTPQLYVTFSFNGRERTKFDFRKDEEVSRPVTLLGMIGNKSPQPAHYFVIKVGLPEALRIIPSKPWGGPISESNDEFGEIDWYTQAFRVPPSLPVFKELEQPLDEKGIGLSFYSNTLHGLRRWPLIVEIVCPGFSSRDVWYIQQQGPDLRLLPSGHPLLQ